MGRGFGCVERIGGGESGPVGRRQIRLFGVERKALTERAAASLGRYTAALFTGLSRWDWKISRVESPKGQKGGTPQAQGRLGGKIRRPD